MHERTIFLNALDCSTPEAVAAYLDEVCDGDVALRGRVESLLTAHAAGHDLMDALASAGASPEQSDRGELPDLSFLGQPQSPGTLGTLGDYQILNFIGRGGMGYVFKARDVSLQRIVAIKVLAPEIAAIKSAKRRFAREAQAAAAVLHDNVVTIHAVGEAQGLPYLVMECIVGSSLQEKIEETGPLELREILRIGSQIAAGLAAAHRQGLVHRDIKPSNILLQNGIQRVKITDFGLARATDDIDITQSGQIAGTPLYMSPEQAQGQKVDHLSDLFSLGSVLYTMCTGRSAFRASSTVAVLRRVVDDTPRPIRSIVPEIPQWLADQITRLMSKSKAERHQSAIEVAELLSRQLAKLQEPQMSQQSLPRPKPLIPDADSNEETMAVPRQQPRPALVTTIARPAAIAAGVVSLMVVGVTLGLNLSRWTAPRPTDTRTEPVPASPTPADVPTTRKPPQDHESWIREVAELPPNRQVEAVQSRLQELNPRFRGTLTVNVEDNHVRGVTFPSDGITNLTPVIAFRNLTTLICPGTPAGSELTDLAPLSNLKLTELNLEGTRVTDLSSLQALPLRTLRVGYTPVTDLSPLKTLKLKEFSCWHTAVSDLSPLAPDQLEVLEINGTPLETLAALNGFALKSVSMGSTSIADLTPLGEMPLEALDCSRTPVSDLSPLSRAPLHYLNCGGSRIASLEPLRNAPLRSLICADTAVNDLAVLEGKLLNSLYCGNTRISSLAPLKGMPLTELSCRGLKIDDFSMLEGMPLRWIDADLDRTRDEAVLNSLESLLRINGKTVAEWREHPGRPD